MTLFEETMKRYLKLIENVGVGLHPIGEVFLKEDDIRTQTCMDERPGKDKGLFPWNEIQSAYILILR